MSYKCPCDSKEQPNLVEATGNISGTNYCSKNYNAYDEYQVTSLSNSEAKGNSIVPSKVKVYGKNKSVSKDKALKDGKYSVIVLSAKEESSKENKINTKLTVAGKIKYAVNAKKVDSNTVKVTSVKEPVVVIYK